MIPITKFSGRLGNQLNLCYNYPMVSFNDLTGKNFGRWKVIGFSYRKELQKHNYQMWDCLCECGEKKIVEGSSLKKGNSVSCGCFRIETIPKGNKHYEWKEKGLGYWGVHHWLRKTFGKANKCEGERCRNNSSNYQWAKLKNKGYERNRDNFIMLCRSCHSLYDGASKNLP